MQTAVVVLLCCLNLGALGQDEQDYWSVYKTGSEYRVRQGKWDNDIAYAFYKQEQTETGWDRMFVTTNGVKPDEEQMYGAGYLEGAISWKPTWDSWANFVLANFVNTTLDNLAVPTSLTSWVSENLAWVRSQVTQYRHRDPYWNQIGLIMSQFDGLLKGYNDRADADKQLTEEELYLLNGDGDLEELQILTNAPLLRNSVPYHNGYGAHCSALVKHSRDKKDLFVGHTTWSTYADLLRQWKIYTFNLNSALTSAKTVSFSGYPGCLLSIDDFYVTSANLAVTETTNGFYNNDLYKKITTASIVSWIRTIAANRIATDSESWVKTFARYNSGTYNNQWIVVDYNKFVPGSALKPDTVWILEQLPGQCRYEDVTHIINQQSYWPSYNVPYFKDIYEISGFGTYEQKYGALFSYSECPRALIFHREQSSVNSVGHMKFLMRFNEWQSDPFAQGNAGNAISSRFDLVNTTTTNPFLQRQGFGGIDSKITSAGMMKHLQAEAISGPTYYQQPVFAWANGWESVPHYGCPDQFSFDWQLFQAQTIRN